MNRKGFVPGVRTLFSSRDSGPRSREEKEARRTPLEILVGARVDLFLSLVVLKPPVPLHPRYRTHAPYAGVLARQNHQGHREVPDVTEVVGPEEGVRTHPEGK